MWRVQLWSERWPAYGQQVRSSRAGRQDIKFGFKNGPKPSLEIKKKVSFSWLFYYQNIARAPPFGIVCVLPVSNTLKRRMHFHISYRSLSLSLSLCSKPEKNKTNWKDTSGILPARWALQLRSEKIVRILKCCLIFQRAKASHCELSQL